MSSTLGERTPAVAEPGTVLESIERRVLWLATAIVDHANRVRSTPSGLEVGGHQASSASMVTIMTALWFTELTAQDRVSVEPHASPVLQAINHLLGELPAEALTTLRQFGGIQGYPSRSKDPVPADCSTGSVGIGATAPVWGAMARRCGCAATSPSACAALRPRWSPSPSCPPTSGAHPRAPAPPSPPSVARSSTSRAPPRPWPAGS